MLLWRRSWLKTEKYKLDNGWYTRFVGRGLRKITPESTHGGVPAPRLYEGWDEERLEKALLDKKLTRAERYEVERELWRRPGGSGFFRGQRIGPLTIEAIDADRFRIIVSLETGGLCSLTRRQAIRLLSDGRIPYPTIPDKKRPPEPFDYGQYTQRFERPDPAHESIPGIPESEIFSKERRRIDARRDYMSKVRQETDIVEFEKMYWEQAKAELELSRAVAAAGGFEHRTGFWGARYVVHAILEEAEAWEEKLRRIYEHIREMRASGKDDEGIISYLEETWGSPFGGPRSSRR